MATRSLASFLVWNAWFLYQNPSWIFRVGFYKVSLPKSLIKVKKIERKKKKQFGRIRVQTSCRGHLNLGGLLNVHSYFQNFLPFFNFFFPRFHFLYLS